jgi:hypothetical protein
MDLNIYYYSYSTLAGALAAAFGFLAAVVVYRLQSLNSQLEKIASHLMGDPRTFVFEPFRTLYAYHRWPLFVNAVKKDQDSSNRNPIFKNLNFLDIGAMDHANLQILSIRRWFIISMVMTFLGISFCLFALFLMQWVSSPLILAGLIAYGVLSLSAYMRLMLIVLQ